MDLCVVRDPEGKPKIAEKVRDIYLTEHHTHFILSRVESTMRGLFVFTVIEPLTGSTVGYSCMESGAIDSASKRLASHPHESFLGGIKMVLDKYGPLPTIEEMLQQTTAK